MDKFAKKLAKILKENEEVSVYGMAKETGCNRTWLQKILAGERAMSIKYIRPVCEYLGRYCRKGAVSELYETFIRECFGDKLYCQVMYVKRRMEEIEKNRKTISEQGRDDKSKRNELLKENSMSQDEKNICKQVLGILDKEMKKAEREKRTAGVQACFPVSWEYLRRIFLYYWNSEEYQCKKECHITWGNAEKEDYAKIEEVLASYEFFQYQIEVFRRNYSNPAEESMTLYPYYIITDNCMLLFSRDGKNCVQITNEDNIQAGRKLYYEMEEDCEKLTRHLDLNYYFSRILPGLNQENIYLAGEESCLNKIISGYGGNRILQDYYEKIKAASVHRVMTVDELMKYKYYYPERLAELYHYYKDKEEEQINLIDTEKYEFCRGIVMGIMPGSGIQIMNVADTNHWNEKMISYASADITEVFYHFYLYLINSDICINKRNTLLIMENCMDKIEYKKLEIV